MSAIYGTCDDVSGDCAPPLEIQSWPSCARSASSYDTVAPDGTDLEPSTAFAASGSVPSASFEGGTRQEVYLPSVTVVIFATNAAVARSAADAVAIAAAGSGADATGTANAPATAPCGSAAALQTDAANAPPAAAPTIADDATANNSDAAVAASDPAPVPEPAGTDDDTTTTAGSTP